MKVILIFVWTVFTTHWSLSSLRPSMALKNIFLRKRLWFFEFRIHLVSNLLKSWDINRQIYWIFIRSWVHFIMFNWLFTFFIVFMQIMLFKCWQIWLKFGITGWDNEFTFTWKNTMVRPTPNEWISFYFFFWLSLHPYCCTSQVVKNSESLVLCLLFVAFLFQSFKCLLCNIQISFRKLKEMSVN